MAEGDGLIYSGYKSDIAMAINSIGVTAEQAAQAFMQFGRAWAGGPIAQRAPKPLPKEYHSGMVRIFGRAECKYCGNRSKQRDRRGNCMGCGGRRERD